MILLKQLKLYPADDIQFVTKNSVYMGDEWLPKVLCEDTENLRIFSS